MSESIKDVLIDGGLPVALSDTEGRFIYNLLPVGEFYDKRYGRISITHSEIQQMADNFGKCPSYEVPVKIGHSDGAKSPGKVINVNAKPEGLEITMLVDNETAQAINDKQYRYMSAEFDEDYHDKKTGDKVGAVLLGAALVNQPAHPYVAPLVLADDINPPKPESENPEKNSERKDENMSELEELKAQKAQLEAEMKTLREQSEANAKKLSDIEAQNKALLDEKERAEIAAYETEVKACCDKWIAQGVPPVSIEKIKPALLNQRSRTIKLSDNPKDDTSLLKIFGEFIDTYPKIPMTQISTSETPSVELSDVDMAKKRAKAIAESIR